MKISAVFCQTVAKASQSSLIHSLFHVISLFHTICADQTQAFQNKSIFLTYSILVDDRL